jgi:hypothetical protein
MRELSRPFLEKLDQCTFEDLVRPKSKLRRLLGVDQERAVAWDREESEEDFMNEHNAARTPAPVRHRR